jgi:microcystin-dependent protein
MANPFVAEIRIVPFNFAPKGWAFCDGQLLSIAQNTALFSLLGTTYGGDGRTNFALPNLQGCAPMHPNQGPGLTLHNLGETGGSDNVTLDLTSMSAHGHPFTAAPGSTATSDAQPAPNVSLGPSVGGNIYDAAPAVPVALDPTCLAPTGGSQPHNNLQPYLALHFVIAMQGVYPPR